MLIESIVRFTLGIKDHRIVSVKFIDKELRIILDAKKRRMLPCSICEKRYHSKDILKERRWSHVSLWGIPVSIYYRHRKFKCPKHGVKVESMPSSMVKRPLSFPLITVLAFWSRLLPWDQVGRLFSVSWNTVRGAAEAAVEYGREREDYKGVRFIGIDEISRKKNHTWHTNVYDLERKRLIWSGAHRDRDPLRRFFQWWGEERMAAIEGVCCDMWQNYIDVVHEYCGEAVIVFDKFHIVRHLLEAIDKVGKIEAKALAETGRETLKGTKYIWLKNPWNVAENQKITLSEFLKSSFKIVRECILKEMFRRLWDYTRKAWAARYLKRWFWSATHSRLKPLRDFVWMLRRNKEGILAYFDLRIDNGIVEGMNNSAKAISHRTRGYRSENTFSLAMIHGLGNLHLPECQHRF